VRLHDLKDLLERHRLAAVVAQIESGLLPTLEDLEALELQKVPQEKRGMVARAFYMQAKATLGRGELCSAVPQFRSAHQLEPHNSVYTERLRLLEMAVAHHRVFTGRMRLLDMQRELGLVCVRAPCVCDTLFRIAKCRGAIDGGFPQRRSIGGIVTYTVGPYYARFPHGKWTGFLKQVKHQFNRELIEPLAEVVATFILFETPLMASADILVPIPPSTGKFSERGFAPNDLVAVYLQTRLGLPVCSALRRKSGIPTREASDEELASQFEMKVSAGKKLKGLSILLLEDIWTTGRTIAVCAEKLRVFGPEQILAVAVGKTS
jgi:hypothetical protein